MKKQEMSVRQKETAIRHSNNNIVRAIVLLKRADNTLTFADKSLEGTDMLSMIQDIGMSRDNIVDAIRRLEEYMDI